MNLFSKAHKQDDNFYCTYFNGPECILWKNVDFFICLFPGDKHLMQSLIFDAQATEVFDKNISLSIDRQDP